MKNANTTYTFDEQIVSDLHKDAYGFRPSRAFYQGWEASSDAEKQLTWDHLVYTLEHVLDEKAFAQDHAIQAFEARICDILEVSANTRADAIRWLEQALDIRADEYPAFEELEYQLDLPYGYVAESLA